MNTHRRHHILQRNKLAGIGSLRHLVGCRLVLSGLLLLIQSLDPGLCLAQQKPLKEPVTLSGILPPARVLARAEWWERIRKNETDHGYHHTRRLVSSKTLRRGILTIRETEVDRVILRRAVKELTTVRCEENDLGVLQSFRFKRFLGDNVQLDVVGHRVGRKLELVSTRKKTETKKVVPVPRGILSEFFPLRDIQKKPLEKNETRRYKIFKVESQQVVTQRWQADQPRIVRLPNGSSRKLLKVRVSDSGNPGVTKYVYLDSSGNVVFSKVVHRDQTVFATLLLNENQVGSMIVASLKRRLKPVIFLESLKGIHKEKQANFRLTYFGNSFPVELPTSQTQHVSRVDEKSRDIEIELAKLQDFQQVSVRMPAIPTSGRILDYRKRAVLDLVRRAAPIVSNPVQKAFRLEKYVFRNMKLAPFSPQLDSASVVAKSMQGDSTEYATLLAAMLRASRIPSRLAFGFRHSPRLNAFVVHFWTEAWLRGSWFPLDATRGEAGISLDYIKLGDTLLDDSQSLTDVYRPFLELLPQLQIQVVDKDKKRK